ncbi:unnamed protein product [Onchocerca flexuosa]|uniref:SH2 domain-containing protein n=1 Tax=Onchocerca flexuosa TaxID=387005 RepID=A0A183HSV3_9BILA|nr:unnamed protein product [Onchocerca flexuosa]
MLSVPPRLSDQSSDQKESLVPDDSIHYISESTQVGCEHPPEMQAPSLPGTTLGYRPQRPYTLDLTSPPTPAESGISTAGSSYRSFSSTDQGPQDHAPSSSVDPGMASFFMNLCYYFYVKSI